MWKRDRDMSDSSTRASSRASTPERSFEESNVTLDLLSKRLVDYFVVYSCKPRRRNKDESQSQKTHRTRGSNVDEILENGYGNSKGKGNGGGNENGTSNMNTDHEGGEETKSSRGPLTPENFRDFKDLHATFKNAEHELSTTPSISPRNLSKRIQDRAVHLKVAPDGGIVRNPQPYSDNKNELFSLNENDDEELVTPLVVNRKSLVSSDGQDDLHSILSDGGSSAAQSLRGIRVPVSTEKALPSDSNSSENDYDYDDNELLLRPLSPTRDREDNDSVVDDVLTPSRLRAIDSDDDEETNVGGRKFLRAIDDSDDEESQNGEETKESKSSSRGNIYLPRMDSMGVDEGMKNPDITSAFTLLPVQTARFPPDDHLDCPLNPMISHFCFPERLNLSTEYNMPRIHYFVLTNDKGNKMYGTCLTIFEPYNLEDDSHGFDEDEVEWIMKMKEVIHESRDDQSIEVSLPSVYQRAKNVIYVPKVLCILSSWPYLHSFREYLGQLYRLATMTNMMTTPIEKYIINICSETPAPPPGKFELRLKIMTSTLKFWAPPGNQPIAYVALPFEILFECLDIHNIIFVWYALTLERKVLLVSSQYSLLTVCSEILCSLLFPMQWSHLYIPIVPKFLTPMLEAPMPYLCGITRENFMHAIGDICDETIVVDLDQNLVTMGNATPRFPPCPLKRRSKLEKALEKSAGDVFWSSRGLTKAMISDRDQGNGILKTDDLMSTANRVWNEKLVGYDNAFNLAFTPDSETLLNGDFGASEKMEPSQWDSVQEAFLRFHVSMLRGYTKHISGKDGNQMFKTKAFISAQKTDHRPFLNEFCYTQQFDCYLTKKLFSPKDPSVLFFEQSITAKKNRSKMKLRKTETPFLHSAKAHKKLTTVDALEPSEHISQTTDMNLLDQFYGLSTSAEPTQYTYETWPDTFDDSRFGTPRPIPVEIAAEFERMQDLSSTLMLRHAIIEEEDFRPGVSHPSVEIATFTLFFALYCELVVGKEFEEIRNTYHNDLPDGLHRNTKGFVTNKKESVEEEGIVKSIPFIRDCSKSVCSPCSGGSVASKTITDETIATLQSLQSKVSPPETQTFIQVNDEVSEEDIDAAQIVATGQLDLAFSCLEAMVLRSLPADQDSMRVIMAACGRCGSTGRATQLITLMKEQSMIVDGGIHTSYLKAFSVANEINPDKPIQSPLAQAPFRGVISRHGKRSMTPLGNKKNRSQRHPTFLITTDTIDRHIAMGDSLLEYLYQGLSIDDKGDTCPQCSTFLGTEQVMKGWKLCSFQEFTTKCPHCRHQFIPRFIVKSDSPQFTGSGGPGTPLYCEFFSPWVLRRELHIATGGGKKLDSILNPEWRDGNDLNAKLWWNLIVSFRRQKLPLTFLLQGSFRERLIMPMG